MKSMLVSLLFFLITVTIVSVNCFFVTKYLGDTYEQLSELPFASAQSDTKKLHEDTLDILETWKRKLRFLSLSINNAELRDYTAVLGQLSAYSKSDTPADYNAFLAEARVRIRTLLARESFSLINIF